MCYCSSLLFFFFFFNDTATTEIYTLSLHDALPIPPAPGWRRSSGRCSAAISRRARSEEHTSELQSPCKLVCRLLLEKKNKIKLPQSYARKTDTVEKEVSNQVN